MRCGHPDGAISLFFLVWIRSGRGGRRSWPRRRDTARFVGGPQDTLGVAGAGGVAALAGEPKRRLRRGAGVLTRAGRELGSGPVAEVASLPGRDAGASV